MGWVRQVEGGSVGFFEGLQLVTGVEDWICDVSQSEYITYIEIKKELTHRNAINVRFPSFVVILI